MHPWIKGLISMLIITSLTNASIKGCPNTTQWDHYNFLRCDITGVSRFQWKLETSGNQEEKIASCSADNGCDIPMSNCFEESRYCGSFSQLKWLEGMNKSGISCQEIQYGHDGRNLSVTYYVKSTPPAACPQNSSNTNLAPTIAGSVLGAFLVCGSCIAACVIYRRKENKVSNCPETPPIKTEIP